MIFPSKVGTGTLGVCIGFCIPMALFFLSPPIEDVAEQVAQQETLVAEDAKSQSARPSGSHEELAEIIILEEEVTAETHESVRARMNYEGQLGTSKQLIRKNNELLRLLEREYEELELDADNLLGVAGIVVSDDERSEVDRSGESSTDVQQESEQESEEVNSHNQPKGFKLVGEGKQWLEPSKKPKTANLKVVGEGKSWVEPVQEARAQAEIPAQILSTERKPQIERESVNVQFGQVEEISPSQNSPS